MGERRMDAAAAEEEEEEEEDARGRRRGRIERSMILKGGRCAVVGIKGIRD